MNAPSQEVQPENPIKKTVLKSPMQLRISLQRSNYNMENNEYCKNNTKIAPPDQYSISFTNNRSLLYIIFYIKLRIGNHMDQGHYVCDVLDYNTGTLWNCDEEKVTQYPGYPMNVYNDLSSDKKQKLEKERIWMDQIGLCPWYILG